MKLGPRGIWVSLESLDLEGRIAAAQRIEALGYTALWHPMAMQRDLMVVASQLLASTDDLVLATGIIPIFERAPAVMAAGHHALNEQSGGRFLLGLGVSHPPIVEQMHGLTYGPPVTSMRAYLDAMDRGPDMSIFLGPDAAPGEAEPVQTGPPRVLAALGPKMLALSRDRAQGAHPYFMPPGHTALGGTSHDPQWRHSAPRPTMRSTPGRLFMNRANGSHVAALRLCAAMECGMPGKRPV